MVLNLRKASPKRLREANIVPGVLYGKGFPSTSIQIDEKELMTIYKQYGRSLVFDVELEGKKHKVYIKDVQYQLLSNNRFSHFDLLCVSQDSVITADIPVVVNGREEIEKQKLFLEMAMHSVKVEYPATKGIANFEFDVSKFAIDDAVYVKDIIVEEEITILDNPDQMILIVKQPTMIEEVAEEAEVSEEEEGSKEEQTADE